MLRGTSVDWLRKGIRQATGTFAPLPRDVREHQDPASHCCQMKDVCSPNGRTYGLPEWEVG